MLPKISPVGIWDSESLTLTWGITWEHFICTDEEAGTSELGMDEGITNKVCEKVDAKKIGRRQNP